MSGDETTELRSSSSARSEPRFVPGVVLAERYRIISMLGRGGMGEVYRADDLKLEVPVALKFLPESAGSDGRQLDRMLGEVRTARKISHPNVCRVYDVGEVDGQHFLSMELIEGEDLASLLRRIGRLPEEKALEIARQLCAGLAAAHDHGVIHRDLKPANVMIDDRGRARITDFGLAAVAEDLSPHASREGTPAYQAPEQLEGREVTLRSDIYALGLVLYELFTGKRPFRADSREELLRLQMESSPRTPSSLVDRVDPLVEKAILACLRAQPESRPASPLQVAAMLPGGDPLQAALAAGETPSPDAVAGASAEGRISPLRAMLAFGAVVALLVIILLAGSRTLIVRQVPMPLSPEQLNLRAEQVLVTAGATMENRQRVGGWAYDEPLFRSMRSRERTQMDWLIFREHVMNGITPPILFWHQTSDELQIRDELRAIPTAIPLARPGDTRVALDPEGRLQELAVVAPPGLTPSAEPDWGPLLAETVVRPGYLAPDAAEWTPPVFADRVFAWKSTDAEIPIRIEAASAGGKPVWLTVLAPGEVPQHAADPEPPVTEQIFLWLLIGFYVIAIVAGAFMAWRNVRSGRGDRRGAFRVAAFLFTARMLSWVLGGLHLASVYEIALFAQALMEALFSAAVLWTLYIALEPIIRRVWPQRLISWSRVLVGSWRDPMVGREVLVGTVAGLIISAGNLVSWLFISRSLGRDFDLSGGIPTALEGVRGFLFTLLGTTTQGSLIVPFASLTFIVLIGIVVRRMTLAAIIYWALFTIVLSLEAPSVPTVWLANSIVAAAFTIALVRFGLLAAVVSHFVFFFMSMYPITPDPGAWFFPISCTMIGMTLALAAYGIFTSVSARSTWLSEESLR